MKATSDFENGQIAKCQLAKLVPNYLVSPHECLHLFEQRTVQFHHRAGTVDEHVEDIARQFVSSALLGSFHVFHSQPESHQ